MFLSVKESNVGDIVEDAGILPVASSVPALDVAEVIGIGRIRRAN